jgi:hypothetical protein
VFVVVVAAWVAERALGVVVVSPVDIVDLHIVDEHALVTRWRIVLEN